MDLLVFLDFNEFNDAKFIFIVTILKVETIK